MEFVLYSQVFKPSDKAHRVIFCTWYVLQYAVNQWLVWNILWTDKCLFVEGGSFNCDNGLYWSYTDLFYNHKVYPQQRIFIYLCAEFRKTNLLVLFFIKGN